mgnify:FL=1
MKIGLEGGFIFDVTYLAGAGKIEEHQLESCRDLFLKAEEKMTMIRKEGVYEGHFSKDGTPEPVLFPGLLQPNPEKMARLKEITEEAKRQYDTVISFGIGGSYLGNKMLFDLFCGPYWNQMSKEERGGCPKLYFNGDNLDPEHTSGLIEQIKREAGSGKSHGKNYRLLLIVISKSGGTVDTMATFFVMKEALEAEGIMLDVWVITDPAEGDKATTLGRIAAQEGWIRFEIPEGIGGRFSVLSESGLVTAALTGVDVDQLLAGAAMMDRACGSANWRENPALLNGALKWLGAEKYGKWIEVFMPYGPDLKSLSEWYVQLMAESLGKKKDLAGNEVDYGRTPVVAVGTTDMHAQTQAHQEGRRDKIVQFVSVKKWRQDLKIPNLYRDYKTFASWNGVTLGEALEGARKSNEEALASDGRWSANLVLAELNEYHVGSLLYFLMLSVVYEGILANIDPFDQPGVEAYKKILGPMLEEIRESKT